jgi:hypothetical protein
MRCYISSATNETLGRLVMKQSAQDWGGGGGGRCFGEGNKGGGVGGHEFFFLL